MGGLRVLLIGPYPMEDGKVVGGVESVVSSLAPALANANEIERVTVLSFIHGVGITGLREINGKLHVWHLRGQDRLSLPTNAFLEVIRARRVVAEVMPDIVHGQGIGINGHIATSLSGRAVITAHGMLQREIRLASRGRLIDFVRIGMVDRLVRKVLRCAAVVISTSQYDARSLDSLIHGNVLAIPNPVPEQYFDEYEIDRSSKNVLFAGMMLPRKNVQGLVRAFNKVREVISEARLVIAGPATDGSYLSNVREDIKALGMEESVDFLGHIDGASLLKQIRNCAVVSLFSNEETSPTLIAQAMAVGRPVVASRVGGVPEMVIDGETGYLVDQKDETTLSERLTTLLKSPDISKEMGIRAREFARQRFLASKVARQTIDGYRVAIES